MADYRDKFEEWRETARRKARELDEKYNIKERVESGARAAQEAVRQGAERVEDVTGKARTEAERLAQDFELNERVRRATEDARAAANTAASAAKDIGQTARDATRDAAREASDALRDVGKQASERFGGVYEDARGYYERAAKFYEQSARVTRLTTAASVGAFRAIDWVRQNPKRAITVSLSIAAGVRLGASFPGLDATLLGAHPHWLTHSALPVWALRRAGEKFDGYLRSREELISRGELTQAERERVEFERKIVRYVGAPLLGAFSCAAGAAMWAQIFQPGAITGAPISWLLGGNPFLDGVWLFGNGIICFHQGYKFFMIALRDQEDAARIVRELRGLLPAASAA